MEPINTKLLLNRSVLFKNNNCGAIASTDKSHITVCDSVTFESNWGEMGGAMYLRDSNIILQQHSSIVTLYNRATLYGDVIFHMDNINKYQCSFAVSTYRGKLIQLPECFLELENLKFSQSNKSTLYEIHSCNDSAGIDGQFIYGGLMDKCHVSDTHENYSPV